MRTLRNSHGELKGSQFLVSRGIPDSSCPGVGRGLSGMFWWLLRGRLNDGRLILGTLIVGSRDRQGLEAPLLSWVDGCSDTACEEPYLSPAGAMAMNRPGSTIRVENGLMRLRGPTYAGSGAVTPRFRVPRSRLCPSSAAPSGRGLGV